LVGLYCGRGLSEGSDQVQIDFANGLFHRGFFEEAAQEYGNYLEEFPEGEHKATALYRLGESHYAAGHYEKALEAFTQLLASGLGDEALRQRATLSKGEVLYYLKRFEEAAKVLGGLAEGVDEQTRTRALYHLGKVYHDSGKPDKAIERFTALLEQYPENALAPYARYQTAFVHLSQEDLESAAVAFSEVAGSHVDEHLRMESRFRAAETYDKIGWFSAAVKEYERLKSDFPDSEYARRAEYGYTWALYHAGKYAEASVAAERFIKTHPDAPESVGMTYLCGNCLQQQKQYDAAAEVYQRIMAEHPESPFALRSQYKLGWVFHLAGTQDRAREQVTAFLKTCQDEAMLGDAAFLLGKIVAAEGNYEDAYQEFRLVAEKYPDGEFGAEALYKAGECLAQLGRISEAAKVFEQFANRYPDNPLTEEALLRVGDAQLSSDAFEEAVAKYKAILESPATPSVEENTLYRLAITYYNMKDYTSSTATYQQIIERFPSSPHVPEAHFRIGDHYLRDIEDPLKAIAPFEAALHGAPEGKYAGRALKGLALAHYQTKDYEDAVALFLRLMREYPRVSLNEETYAWVGQRCFDAERWADAATAFDALLTAEPDYPNPERVRFKVAECSEAAGKLDEAIRLFGTVVETAPASTLAIEARYRMARLYETAGNSDKALELYEQAANTNNSEAAARARFRLGELYEAKGEFATAARSYLRVAILFLHEDLSPESLWRAGQCFEKAESLDQARKTYGELVKDYADTDQATKAKERLAALG